MKFRKFETVCLCLLLFTIYTKRMWRYIYITRSMINCRSIEQIDRIRIYALIPREHAACNFLLDAETRASCRSVTMLDCY